MILGIDPGCCGAAWWGTDASGWAYEAMDCSAPADVAETLRRVRAATPGALVMALERNHASPIMGRMSAFSFGCSWGIVRGAAAALEIPVVMVTAQKWRAFALAGRGVPKDRAGREAATLGAARERWPGVEWPKARAKAQAVACAAWIAAYAATEAR